MCTLDDLVKNFDKSFIMDIIILDFSEAFDRVSQRKLIHIVINFGINIKILDWISSFLLDSM